jgi:hypothetical protein
MNILIFDNIYEEIWKRYWTFYNQKMDLFITKKCLKLTGLFFRLKEEEAPNIQSIIRQGSFSIKPDDIVSISKLFKHKI